MISVSIISGFTSGVVLGQCTWEQGFPIIMVVTNLKLECWPFIRCRKLIERKIVFFIYKIFIFAFSNCAILRDHPEKKIVILGWTIPLNAPVLVCNVMKVMPQDMNTGTGWKHCHLSLPRASRWRHVRLVLWCQNWALLTTVTAVRSSTLHSSQHKDALDCHTTVCEALRQSLEWQMAVPYGL